MPPKHRLLVAVAAVLAALVLLFWPRKAGAAPLPAVFGELRELSENGCGAPFSGPAKT